jgi:hypothetical protein
LETKENKISEDRITMTANDYISAYLFYLLVLNWREGKKRKDRITMTANEWVFAYLFYLLVIY